MDFAAGAMEGWAARNWDLDELKQRFGEHGGFDTE